MAHSSYIEFSNSEREQLLDIARQSIHSGLEAGKPLSPNLSEFSEKLSLPSATFVTLKQRGDLRGCIGSLESTEPLVQSIANSAFNAAFRDPRFASLQTSEIKQTSLEISVLSEMTPMTVASREDLFNQLKPGIDGLLLQDRGYRSTFLPKVWDDLKEPQAFLEQLFLKAGLAPDHWSETLRFSRYQTVNFGGEL